MTSIENTITQPQLIAISRLERSPLNARKTQTQAGIDELKASILAHGGILHNLVVTEGEAGMYRVIDGGRRLEALKALQAEGKLPADYLVPCQIRDERNALETSLAANTVRLDMHLADQFEAFAELIEQGQTAEQVAEHFATEPSRVVRLMKLARVAPVLIEEFRNDRLSLACLMAFTVTDDHRRQLKVFKALQDWQKNDARHIRACLTEKMIDAGSKLARFVGIDAYQAAGGTSRDDLFGEEVYLEKPALLHKLADAKLAGIRKELEAEGWGWVEINPERDWQFVNRCDRIQPRLLDAPAEMQAERERIKSEMAEINRAFQDTESDALIDALDEAEGRLADIEEKLAAFVDFDPEHKPLAGCCVSIGQDGATFLDKGLVKPEHKKQLARLLKADDGDGTPEKAKPKSGMPATLRRDLAAYRQQAAQAELPKHPAIALDLVIFTAVRSAIGTPVHTGPDVRFLPQRPKLADNVKTVAGEALKAIRSNLPLAWLRLKTEAAQYEAFRQLPEAEKLDLLACCVALTLQPTLSPGEGDASTAYDAALSLTGADVAGYWRPARDSYLSRITREQLLAIGRDTLGEAWSQSRWKDKKTTLVDQLDRAFSEPEKHGRTPEQVEKLKRWLPAGMAFTIAASPRPKAKKARKAA